MANMREGQEVKNPSKRSDLFRYDPENPPDWARQQGLVPRRQAHPSLEDQVLSQRAQQASTPRGKARQARRDMAPQRNPDPLGGGLAVAIAICCGLLLVAIFWMKAIGWLPS